MCAIDAKTAQDAIRSMFVVLIDGLPIDSLMPALIQESVVTTLNQQKMSQMSSETDKTAHLLNEIVIRSLKAKVLTVFENFLKVMEASEDLTCQSLGKDLSAKVGKVKISLPKIIPPSGNDHYTNTLDIFTFCIA